MSAAAVLSPTMTPRSPSAFMLSAGLHAGVVALLLLLSYSASRNTDETAKVFELVAGEGNDYMAKEAPLLGTPGGLKLTTPNVSPTVTPPAQPREEPKPEPEKPKPFTPKQPPQAKEQPKKAPTERLLPNIRREQIKVESQVKQAAKKERDRIAKEESEKARVAQAPKTTSTKGTRIDVEGIQKGVLGGSAKSKEGAGGKALHSDNEEVLGAYFALFKERVHDNFEAPPGLSESLRGEFEFTVSPDGSISGSRVLKTSGSREFDEAVLRAMRRVRMPSHPYSKRETVVFSFSMADKQRG